MGLYTYDEEIDVIEGERNPLDYLMPSRRDILEGSLSQLLSRPQRDSDE